MNGGDGDDAEGSRPDLDDLPIDPVPLPSTLPFPECA
eukprot:CAMPEP_0113324980 /NCGR_PEP_ID=MMETSP0010_2-20120614/17420_1 /TAXON_ID=216773 ORGANISM="Corethron hystrix, Strain 308" /NCGR_SAMPLE_ID=MMETSP0010_2 /ASSEMBLY_ACC=CAM_ASM_000155 /LENGTH=36 /DNA_ID=CAMNT_0000184567 /DNA_START=119 /DNA_END=225 /DNA_ORIENTATION=+ /assembly_acc=CAM_ASM_000155